MSKLTFTVSSIISTGTLCNLYDDLKKEYTDFVETRSGDNRILTDGFSELTVSQLYSIVSSGGKVEEHLMAIRVPASFMATSVIEGLPNRTNPITNSVRTYQNWYDSTAEVWKKDDLTEYMFYTAPHGNSKTEYLTGAMVAAIRATDTENISVLTLSQAATLVATGWTKL